MNPKLTGTKPCSRCSPLLGPHPVIYFGADPDQEDGLSTLCRNCEGEESRRNRERKLEKIGEKKMPRRKWQTWGVGAGIDSLGSWVEE